MRKNAVFAGAATLGAGAACLLAACSDHPINPCFCSYPSDGSFAYDTALPGFENDAPALAFDGAPGPDSAPGADSTVPASPDAGDATTANPDAGANDAGAGDAADAAFPDSTRD